MDNVLMNFNETKKYLNISRATLYRLLDEKKIPAYKVGGQWRFKKVTLDAWLETHAVGEEINIRGAA